MSRPDLRDLFDRDALRRVCLTHETKIGYAYDMARVEIDQPGPENYYYFKDYGSNILAVAHLDTVVADDKRRVTYHDTEDGLVIQSGCLDDRLGAYIILELLPAAGIQFDILLTVGEESGCSTAAGFTTDKEYDWIIEFDRGGMDVVTYDYEDDQLVDRIESVGARHNPGIFSDISYMEHVGVKAMNWGVAYHDYHGPNGYAYIDETLTMVDLFRDFHALYGTIHMPHRPRPRRWRSSLSYDDLMGSWIGGGYVNDGPDDEEMWDDESLDPMWDDDGNPIYADDDDGPECYDDDGFYIGPPDEQRPFVDPDDVIPWPTPEQLRAASLWP